MPFRRTPTACVLVAVALSLAACSTATSDNSSSSSAGSGDSASPGSSASSGGGGKTVTLVTHDSWVAPKDLIAQFTKQTGYTLKVVNSGDAGRLANSLVLTKNSPVGDVTFGVDNTFATRVTGSGALQDYTPTLPDGASKYVLTDAKAAKQLTPIDFGDVCVNVDDAWFTAHHKQPPTGLDDLTKPAYKNLFVTPSAASSSPGMAFLLATIAKYGDNGWQGYWKKLVANGTKITSGWDDAWNVDYTAGGGKGSRPIVLSYNSSPADTIKNGKPTTSALMNTCFQQVEYAGVLNGAKNVAGAKAFIDFMLGTAFQKALPANMYVFPVAKSVALPQEWKTAVKVPSQPLSVDPAKISANRESWLRKWQDATSG